ncbi:MAG TPA: S4 domain-containing protein, partial [Burkholderiaceae bacterium]|nr:S4 domain-containing protein [Burkholderiaceae bacterium]
MSLDDTSDAGERLSKRVAAQLSCSRREAEQLIAQGAVTVDGLAATLPQQRVGSGQRVAVATGARP